MINTDCPRNDIHIQDLFPNILAVEEVFFISLSFMRIFSCLACKFLN